MTIRTLQNVPGVVFDDTKLDTLYAEDYNNLADAVGAIPAVPVKATGAELNTGTDDAKFATAKALADSDYAKTSDIPSVPSKATGAELNTGTDDAKFATPKAIADSNISFINGTETLSNKRINPREDTINTSATPTPSVANGDIFTVTALAVAATFGAPTGTPLYGQKLIIRIKDNGTARALSWNAIYRASSDLALPTTTVVNKTMYLGFIYNYTDSKWDLVALMNNF